MQILWAFRYNPWRIGSSEPIHEIAERQFHGRIIAKGNYALQPGGRNFGQNCVVCHQAWSEAECTSLSPPAADPSAAQNRISNFVLHFFIIQACLHP
ncbi:MAG: hypothetical protein LBK44_01470 [Spirochaetales bacterium]|jgi:mono/diheme cytochrome c family protein|nr:hypothetical protein [Spirochaetales bacterium]